MATEMERSIHASIAANARWAKASPAGQGKRGQAGLFAKFLREVDPKNELPEAERNRRAECAKRAHFQRLALASLTKRRARKSAGAR